jgi:hypothetical protein
MTVGITIHPVMIFGASVIFAPLTFQMERGCVEDEAGSNIRASRIRRLGVSFIAHLHHPSPAGADHAQDAYAPQGVSYLMFDCIPG